MKAVTTAEMRELDRNAIERTGIPSLILMENAGRSVAELIFREYGRAGRAAIVCGKGNNGGDGLVAARHLWNAGWEVRILLLGAPEALKEDPAVNWTIVNAMKIPVWVIPDADALKAAEALLGDSTLVVDALLGVGVTSPLKPFYREAVEKINDSGRPVVAVDIPSGLDSDSGAVLGSAVYAAWTATLGALKQGLTAGEAAQRTGRIEVLDISLPRMIPS